MKGVETMETLTKNKSRKGLKGLAQKLLCFRPKGKKFTDKIMELVKLPKSQEIIECKKVKVTKIKNQNLFGLSEFEADEKALSSWGQTEPGKPL